MLARGNSETEIRKGSLDLLDKINAIGQGTTTTITNADYSEKPDDGWDLLQFMTGATSRVCTLSPSKQVAMRRRTYAKIDSGAGEVVLRCQGQDAIFYPGGSAATMYVGLQYQVVELVAVTGGYLLARGVVQPVALEPDVGGGMHVHRWDSAVAVPGSTAQQTLDLSGQIPSGCRSVGLYLTVNVATSINSTKWIQIEDASSNTYHRVHGNFVGANTFGWAVVPVFSRIAYWSVGSTILNSVAIVLTHYALGPV